MQIYNYNLPQGQVKNRKNPTDHSPFHGKKQKDVGRNFLYNIHFCQTRCILRISLFYKGLVYMGEVGYIWIFVYYTFFVLKTVVFHLHKTDIFFAVLILLLYCLPLTLNSNEPLLYICNLKMLQTLLFKVFIGLSCYILNHPAVIYAHFSV